MKIYQDGMPEHKAEGIYFVDGKLWFTIEAFKKTKHIIPNDHRSNRYTIDILVSKGEPRIVVKSGTRLTFAFEPDVIENYLDLHGITPLVHSSQMYGC